MFDSEDHAGDLGFEHQFVVDDALSIADETSSVRLHFTGQKDQGVSRDHLSSERTVGDASEAQESIWKAMSQNET